MGNSQKELARPQVREDGSRATRGGPKSSAQLHRSGQAICGRLVTARSTWTKPSYPRFRLASQRGAIRRGLKRVFDLHFKTVSTETENRSHQPQFAAVESEPHRSCYELKASTAGKKNQSPGPIFIRLRTSDNPPAKGPRCLQSILSSTRSLAGVGQSGLRACGMTSVCPAALNHLAVRQRAASERPRGFVDSVSPGACP